MKNILLITIFAITIIGCKKKDDKPKYTVTYTFTSTAPSYYVQISDVTNLNDFADSVHTASFTKTITYDYDATYRCRIDNGKGLVSNKSIAITYNEATNTITDDLYPSLEYFITP